MTNRTAMKRLAAIAITAGLALLLAGCLLMPGKFTSRLDIRKDGTFHFAYKGEITMLAMTDLANQAKKSEEGGGTFTPSACTKDNGAVRACTDKEIADQKAEWKAKAAKRKQSNAEGAAMMRTMLGGMNPDDPKAAAAFADALRRGAGWKSVVDEGNGVFDVDYEISGSLDHDFVFPTIEKLPMTTPFVAIYRRADGTLRIDAPSFGPAAGGNPMMAMLAASPEGKAGKAGSGKPKIPQMDGTFTLVTDGTILANNTDEGPQSDPEGQRLTWQVSNTSKSAPTALVGLGK